jgi:elongation factor P hydroxylase
MSSAQPVVEHFSAARLERVFDRCFAASELTRLEGGAEEPLYEPATNPQDSHTLWYREDYFASALHEVAHWCIAGAQRRQQRDFGYWYAPDGRDLDQQAAFERVESKPQALEWFLSRACDYPFRISVDNLDATVDSFTDAEHFKSEVVRQANYWQRQGLPQRGLQFFDALRDEFNVQIELTEMAFSAAELR